MVTLFLVDFRDFDSRLYLCIEAFGFLQMDTFERMSKLLVFPLYLITHITLLVVVFVAVMQNWRWAGLWWYLYHIIIGLWMWEGYTGSPRTKGLLIKLNVQNWKWVCVKNKFCRIRKVLIITVYTILLKL